MYTTVSKVREAAGVVGNSNISDSSISRFITRAEGFVNGYIGDAYTLPLEKYYLQTIVFTGTGTDAGTLTITINGENYAVTVADDMTAAEAADAFRVAALDNGDFVTDDLGSGATVTIYSVEGADYEAVTISSTDPQTVEGITATGGTVTATAVPTVEMLTTEIAAAYLLMQEYGAEAQDTDKDGAKRLAIWEEDLQAIREKKQKVYNFAGVELNKSTVRGLSFYPNDTSEEDADNPTTNRMTMNKKF